MFGPDPRGIGEVLRDWATRELAAPAAAPEVRSLSEFVEQLGTSDDGERARPKLLRHETNVSEEALARPAPGNPILLVLAEGEEDQVVGHREFDCPSYEGCLDFAALRNWPSFSCRACPGPGGCK